MTDIVERLRQKERDYYSRDTGGAFGMGPVLRDAADEIERLRGLLREAYSAIYAQSWPLDLDNRIDAALAGTADQPDYGVCARCGSAGNHGRPCQCIHADQPTAARIETQPGAPGFDGADVWNAQFDAADRARKAREDAEFEEGLCRQAEYMKSPEFKAIVDKARDAPRCTCALVSWTLCDVHNPTSTPDPTDAAP